MVWVILRRVATCFVFALAVGWIFFLMDEWVCGEANGQNAAGGGAAIGMYAVAIMAWAWLLSFVVLTIVDFGKWLKWWSFSLLFRHELLVLGAMVAVWFGVAWWLALCRG